MRTALATEFSRHEEELLESARKAELLQFLESLLAIHFLFVSAFAPGSPDLESCLTAVGALLAEQLVTLRFFSCIVLLATALLLVLIDIDGSAPTRQREIPDGKREMRL